MGGNGREMVEEVYMGGREGREAAAILSKWHSWKVGREEERAGCNVSRVKYLVPEQGERGTRNVTGTVEFDCGFRGCGRASAQAVCGFNEVCRERTEDRMTKECGRIRFGRGRVEVDFGDSCWRYELDLGGRTELLVLCPFDSDLDGEVESVCERAGLGGEDCGVLNGHVGGGAWNRYEEWVGGMVISAGGKRGEWMDLW